MGGAKFPAWVGLSIALAGLAGQRPSRADSPLPPRPPQPETPARTPLPPGAPAEKVPWERHIEVGGDFLFVQRPATFLASGEPTNVRYDSNIGYGLHARWEIFRYLRFGAYFINARHNVELPAGALGLSGKLELDKVESYSFGARLCPTLPLGLRARAWGSLGVGWGRLEFDRMTVTDPGAQSPFTVRERATSFVEFPLGLGGSFDVISRWLSVEVELTGAFVTGERGEATTESQAIDADGKKRHIGAFPVLDATFVQTIGLSLIL